MTQSNYTVPTSAGLAWNARAAAGEAVSPITQMVFGDGIRAPSGGETALLNEVHRVNLAGQGVLDDATAAYFDAYLPAAVGGFVIREHGLLTADGTLVAIGVRDPGVPKADPASGAADDFTYRIDVFYQHLDALAVTIDPVHGLTAERRVDTGTGLKGGGALIQNLTLEADFATMPEAIAGTSGKVMDAELVQAMLRRSTFTVMAFPHVETADHRLNLSDLGDGRIRIGAGNTWTWRNSERFSTSDFTDPMRIFPTDPSKLYHLRWHAPGTGTAVPEADYPMGRFELADMAGLSETATQYDSTLDRMLIARIETDAVNAATITSLANAVQLFDVVQDYEAVTISPQANGSRRGFEFVFDWARTPVNAAASVYRFDTSSPGLGAIHQDELYDADTNITGVSVDRYRYTGEAVRDYTSYIGVQAILQV